MRLFIRGVYEACEKLKNHKALLIRREIMESHAITFSRSPGETNPEKKEGITNLGCATSNNNLQSSTTAFHASELKENCNDLENTNLASKIEKGSRRRPSLTKEQPMIFYFDLETSGLEVGCDILQISVRSGDSHFSSFVTPTKPIDKGASQVNNLYFREGNLYKGNVKLETLPLKVVLEAMIDHLTKFNKKCVLVAHYCPFDSRHLLKKLQDHSILFNKFEKLLYGFADSFEMFADKYPERRWVKGTLTLTKLVEESLGLSTANAHDATVDTLFLQKLVQHHFSDEQVLRYRVTLAYALENRRNWHKKKKAFANTA